ncbi:MAG: hypothetical protein IJK98_10360 [Clostridia bacterium]|nr:hypothetical protein [Clostridia bacterium]
MPGKKKCKILREIRQKIADENDIPFVTEECRYKGDCKGTCPKCEAELRYLEQQLEKRRALGKKVTVSALALGMAASLAGCRQVTHVPEGDVPCETTETESFTLEGVIAETEPTAPETEPTAPNNATTASGNTGAATDAPETAAPKTTEPTAPETEPVTEEEEFSLEGDVMYVPESDYAPENNTNDPLYGPPPTEAPTKKTFNPVENVAPNIYGPPSMMESNADNG